MITNRFNQFKWTFESGDGHDMTTPLVCDLTTGPNAMPRHWFKEVVCSVTIYDYQGGYWQVEGALGDETSIGLGTSDYQYDINIPSPGIIHVYTDCPSGIIMVNGVEMYEMGVATVAS